MGNESLSREREEIFRNFEITDVPLERNSVDLNTNVYGYQLTEFCKNNSVFILNGRLDYHERKLTCKHSTTVDYFVSTAFNFGLLSSLTTYPFDTLLSDTHCPVSLTLTPTNKYDQPRIREHRETEPNIRLWNDEKRESFCQNINYGEILKISSSLDVMASGYNVTSESVKNVNQVKNLFLSASESSFGYTQQNKNSTTNHKKSAWQNEALVQPGMPWSPKTIP